MSNITLTEFEARRRVQKQARKALGRAFRQLDAGLSALFRKQLTDRLPELMAHAQEGMAFRIHIEVVNADGSPLDARVLPKHVESRIILLGDD